MNPQDKDAYINRYNTRFQEFGYDIKTLGWGGDKNRQLLRFQIALEIEKFLNNNTKITSVLDVGCGFGDMGVFLKKFYPDIKYTGIDINAALINEGLKLYPDFDLRCLDLLENNIEETFDLVCENGIFNFRLFNETQLEYIDQMIHQMYLHSKIGISVDFLSTFVDFKHDGAFHMDEYEAIRLLKKYTKRIILRNDYLNFEYTCYALKS